ncbi:SLC13 family permease [Terrisporobacter sp.]|uniref:SLC13 family permease n=1 Tax=Terrisporobacter sp. TaxID=1965305 RepID=UPI002607C866|nr:SLC13 family permease [Terrisporobacter sp.]
MNQLEICLIISTLTIISYAWGKINMGTTAMLSMVAFVLTGCIDAKDALDNFANPNTVMMLSMFVVAAGFNRTKFVRICAHSVNSMSKSSLIKIMFGYIIITVILSQFIQSSMVVFGIMAPMLIASCDELGISPSKVMFPLAIASVSTLGALPLGSGATVFAELNGYLEANAYTSFTVGLMDPMKARLPMIIVSVIYCIFFATKFSPDKPSVELIKMESKKEGEKTLSLFKERAGYIIFILVTLGLVFQKQLGIDTWLICFLGAIMMVITGVLSEQEAIDSVPWWMGFLFVGSLTMGDALTATGAGETIGGVIAKYVGGLGNPYLIGFVFFIVPFLLTQFMMNRSVMTIFIPIAILACKSLGANPVGIIILVQSACLSSFMTPMATPTIPMSMGAGGYDVKDIFKQSIVPAILLCIVSIGWIMTVFPMFP